MTERAPVVRDATEADLPRLLELLHDLSQNGERPESTPEELRAAHGDTLRALRDSGWGRVLVLEVAGEVMGTLTLYLLPNLSHGARPTGLVENVVVAPRTRGQGLGRVLMGRAEELARAHGCYRLALTSNRRRTDSHRFYEGLGFAKSHVGMTHYFDHD